MTKRFRTIGLIAADFNKQIILPMIKESKRLLEAESIRIVGPISVPGCYEIPVVAEALMRKKSISGLVVLGFIERGETLHGEVMGHVVHECLVDLQRESRKPMGLGIIGPGATVEQAERRKELFARNATNAVIKMLGVLESL